MLTWENEDLFIYLNKVLRIEWSRKLLYGLIIMMMDIKLANKIKVY